MSHTVIECHQLCKKFDDGDLQIHAVNHISLVINSGEFIVLYGASGSGKTTLLNLLGGLDRPTSGEVLFESKPFSKMTDSQITDLRLAKIGFIFQAYNLIPVFTALENVAFIMQMQGVSRETYLQKSEAILKRVGLETLMHRRPAELSGGQQQRVAIARAIAAEPQIVLADEPTANLDSENSKQLIQLMQELNREFNMTFVISSHDSQVIDSANRKICLEDGKIVDDETVKP